MKEPTLAELSDLIHEVEGWHEIRARIMERRSEGSKKNPLEMRTLPHVLQVLNAYRQRLAND